MGSMVFVQLSRQHPLAVSYGWDFLQLLTLCFPLVLAVRGIVEFPLWRVAVFS